MQLEEHEYRRFDHLIDALSGGCPPHGGIALGKRILLYKVCREKLLKHITGFDRLMSILCNAGSIRDVIAFPKAAGGKDLVVNSPSEVTIAQLKEYGLRIE